MYKKFTLNAAYYCNEKDSRPLFYNWNFDTAENAKKTLKLFLKDDGVEILDKGTNYAVTRTKENGALSVYTILPIIEIK